MHTFHVKRLLLAAILLPLTVLAQETNKIDSLHKLRASRQVAVPDRCFAIIDIKTPRSEIGNRLYHVYAHPILDSLLTPEQEQDILSQINARCDSLSKDSLLTSDLFWVMRPYFDKLYYEDLHYRISMTPMLNSDIYHKNSDARRLTKQLRMPAFSLIQINDTLIVDRSMDTIFRRGDIVTSINGVTAAEYMKYCYADRHTFPLTIMARYYYSHVTDLFNVEIQRNGQPITITTAGKPASATIYDMDIAESMDNNIRTYADAGCGYIAIPQFFFNNSRVIKIVRKSIMDFKRHGITNVILDLRRNPGGNGHAFDELLSIFIDKPEIEYCKGQRVKASKKAMQYYPFITEDMIGKVVDCPENEIVRSFKTNPKMYIGGVRYYVLVSRDTGSIAASFVNMLISQRSTTRRRTAPAQCA